MIVIKLTDKNMRTYDNTEWFLDEKKVQSSVEKPKLCSTDVFYAYKSIELALLLNRIHSNIKEFRIFEAEGDVVVEDYGKVGVFELTLREEKKIPSWYLNREKRKRVQVQFAVLCAEAVLHLFESTYPDDIRPRHAIEAAKKYLMNKSGDARADAYAAAVYADAYADARADAYAANAAYAAYAAAYAYAANAYAANAYAYAAAYAANAAVTSIDFNKLANKAVEMTQRKEPNE